MADEHDATRKFTKPEDPFSGDPKHPKEEEEIIEEEGEKKIIEPTKEEDRKLPETKKITR